MGHRAGADLFGEANLRYIPERRSGRVGYMGRVNVVANTDRVVLEDLCISPNCARSWDGSFTMLIKGLQKVEPNF